MDLRSRSRTYPPMNARHLIVAIHGILTEQTDANWVDRLHAWIGMTAAVITCRYKAGPFPIWNHFVRNRWLARARSNEIEEFQIVARLREKRPYRVSFIAHSNGCDIAIKTARDLADRGIVTEAIILTGSVTHPDVRRNGVLELIQDGFLHRAFAYCSGSDLPLRLPFAWPYSDLGRRGWADVPAELEDRIVTRWFPGYGHSGYFAPENRERTFEQFASDIGLGGVQ